MARNPAFHCLAGRIFRPPASLLGECRGKSQLYPAEPGPRRACGTCKRLAVCQGLENEQLILHTPGGALPPGAHAKESRKNRPSVTFRLSLASNFRPPLTCCLGEAAPPLSPRWRAPAGSARQRVAKEAPKSDVPTFLGFKLLPSFDLPPRRGGAT